MEDIDDSELVIEDREEDERYIKDFESLSSKNFCKFKTSDSPFRLGSSSSSSQRPVGNDEGLYLNSDNE